MTKHPNTQGKSKYRNPKWRDRTGDTLLRRHSRFGIRSSLVLGYLGISSLPGSRTREKSGQGRPRSTVADATGIFLGPVPWDESHGNMKCPYGTGSASFQTPAGWATGRGTQFIVVSLARSTPGREDWPQSSGAGGAKERVGRIGLSPPAQEVRKRG
jgi:hypothetical protein